MERVVMRRQPSVPAWAWVSAALALLLLVSVVLWSNVQPVTSGPEGQGLKVLAQYPQPAPAASDQQSAYGSASEPSPSVDWSKPGKDYRPPAEPPAKIKKIKIVVGEPPAVKPQEASADTASANTDKVEIPPVKIATGPSVPDHFIYNGVLWLLSRDGQVSSDEVELTELGSVDGHTLYSLNGSETDPSALFVETSPGSGQYDVYRPTG